MMEQEQKQRAKGGRKLQHPLKNGRYAHTYNFTISATLEEHEVIKRFCKLCKLTQSEFMLGCVGKYLEWLHKSDPTVELLPPREARSKSSYARHRETSFD